MFAPKGRLPFTVKNTSFILIFSLFVNSLAQTALRMRDAGAA